MRAMRTALLAYLGASLALAACGSGSPGGHACTEIGCVDQFTATLQDASGGLPSGMQTVTVVADGVMTSCSFTLPLAAGSGTSCPSPLQIAVQPKMMCMSTGTPQYPAETCTPVPGKGSELVTLTGKPAMVHLTQTSGGTTYLDMMLTPTYSTSQPNGPDCPPTCSQASATLTLAAP
jgi:hypothetical protein